ncbi:MAG: glycosyltransferase [Acidimicrobiales bacterium]
MTLALPHQPGTPRQANSLHHPAASREIVIVHERFTERGGSENVVDELAIAFPDARLFSPIIDRAALPDHAAQLPHRSSRIQRLYRGEGRYAELLPLLPMVMANADIGPADVVIASHHAFANRIRLPDQAALVSYVHTPARWMWDDTFRDGEAGGAIGSLGLGWFASSQRRADRAAAQRASLLVANSTTVAERIETWWGRSSKVVAPPVDVDYFTPDPDEEREDFFLLAGRLVPYKRPELAIEAAKAAGVRLVVAGSGRADGNRSNNARSKSPRSNNTDGIEYLGSVDRHELRRLFRRCRALVFPGVEDFGIVPVEAQACGAPVVGVDLGGLRDTVVPGRTGELVRYRRSADAQVALLAEAMRDLDPSRYDAGSIRRHAEQFSARRFRTEMTGLVDRVVSAAD